MSDLCYFSKQDTKEEAEILCEYINKTFNIFHYKSNKAQVVYLDPKDEGVKSYWSGWMLAAPADLRKYSNDFEKVRNGITDFWAGYTLGKKAQEESKSCHK